MISERVSGPGASNADLPLRAPAGCGILGLAPFLGSVWSPWLFVVLFRAAVCLPSLTSSMF